MADLNDIVKEIQRNDHGQNGTRTEIFYGTINSTDATFTVPTHLLHGAMHASVIAVNGGAADETFQLTGTVVNGKVKPSSGKFTFTRTGAAKTADLAVMVRIEGR